MKNILKYGLIALVGIVAVSACNKVMDTKPFESYSEDLVWSNKSTAEAFILGSYGDAIGNFAGSADWESRTPYGAHCSQVGVDIDNFCLESGIDRYLDWGGFGRFGSLRKCNLIIEKVNASTTLTAGEKTALAAEGYLLRGLIYFDMTRKMGRFVPVNKVLSVSDTVDFKAPLTANVAESYKLVMADLDKAVDGLPEKSDKGRANKYAALIFRSRAALQAYAYTNDAQYLDVAINSAKAVTSSSNYSLTSNYGDMFNENVNSTNEVIWAKYYLSKDAKCEWFNEVMLALPNASVPDMLNAGGTVKDQSKQIFGCWGIFWPTQDLVDQYLVIDEADGKAKPWYETSQYLNNVDVLSPSTLTTAAIDTYKMGATGTGDTRNLPSAGDMSTTRTDVPLFKHYGRLKAGVTGRDITSIIYNRRDKRMDQTILRDSSDWLGETWSMKLNGNISAGFRAREDGGWYTTCTNYYWKKNIYAPTPKYAYQIPVGMHYVLCRLGEAYMNLAEAYLLKGDVANAVIALNSTRTTHGGLPASTATSLADAWKDYLRERACEMVYENGDIYFSYLRWGKYGGNANNGAAPGAVIADLTKPVYKIGISRDRKAFCTSQLTVYTSENRTFTQRRYLFPIPQGQIDKRTAFGIIDTQNPGW